MNTVLDKLEEEDYYPKQEPIQSKEQFCFLPIQIMEETIKTGLKKHLK